MTFAFLGTSAAVPSTTRDTTWLVFSTPQGAFLVDCGGSPVARLRLAGVDPLALTHVVVTHLHADHAYGLPALLQNLRLLGRRAPLAILCHPEHVGPLGQLLDVFRLRGRADAPPLTMTPIGLDVGAVAFRLGRVTVRTAPTDHGAMPSFAVRVDVDGPRGAVVYSSDTVPCEAVVTLARDAGTLVHEATSPHRDRGRLGAHSTAREAGEVAARAGVRRLLLAHIDAAYHAEVDALAAEAAGAFAGVVEIARELVPYPLGP